MDDYYEQERTLHEYLGFHYPDEDPLAALLGERTPPLAERFPFAIRELWEPRPEGLALDVGAACGRMTLELAADHRHAIGLDLSKLLVRGAERVRRDGRARYDSVVEGDIRLTHDVAVPQGEDAAFLVADAGLLPFSPGTFDTVIALNLIDRVPDPAAVVDELARLVSPGGILIVASPFTWLTEFTPRERWMVGVETLRSHLAGAFDVDEARRMPFFIPHHARTGQLGVSLVVRARRL